MWKLIFLVLLAWLVYQILSRTIFKQDGNKANTSNPSDAQEEAELMVKCEKCAVHLPRSEAFLIAGEFYCSKAHLPKK